MLKICAVVFPNMFNSFGLQGKSLDLFVVNSFGSGFQVRIYKVTLNFLSLYLPVGVGYVCIQVLFVKTTK